MQTRKRHTNRLKSIEAGKSNLDAQFERDVMGTMQLDTLITETKKTMINYGRAVGPVWDWLTSIKGLKAGSLAAQLLAQFDDVSKFATISKFWRFSGWAVIDGQIDRYREGETGVYNRRLKSVCYLIIEQFIKQRTPVYSDIYYDEKERQRCLHPEPIRENGKWKFNDGHLHRRAMRYTAKRFLSHLYVKWHEAEGLPVPKPYVEAILGHTNIDKVP